MVNEDRTEIAVSSSKTIQRQQALRRQRALKIVNRYTLLSGGIGLIPSPFLYQVAVGGLLGKMLYDLCELYGTRLTKHKNKTIITAVLGGAHSEWITVYLRSHIRKVLPGVVVIGNTVARPVVAAGITYSVGKLFITHFESGAWLNEAKPPRASHLPPR